MNKLYLCLFVFSLVAISANCQTTTVTAESSNNTSASTTFPGFMDFRTTDPTVTPTITPAWPIITNPFDPTPTNVSKLNVHNLLYSGFNGKIFVETQTWFCPTMTMTFHRDYSPQNSNPFPQCNDHLVVGYDSDDINHANAAVDDMFSRGFDGFIADVEGGQNNCRDGLGAPSGTPLTYTFTTHCPDKVLRVDNAVQAMAARIDGSFPTQLQFMLMEDQSAFDGDGNCSIAQTGINQPLCIAQKVESDIQYFNSTYFFTNPNTYVKNAGNPIVAFFVAEEHQGAGVNSIDLSQCDAGSTACNFENGTTCGGLDPNNQNLSQCWTAIWDAVRQHAPVPITMIFENSPGFTHEQSNGSFQWVDPNQATGTSINFATQEDFTNDSEVDNFYQAVGNNPGKIAFGIVKKGFDREDAPFGDAVGLGKVTDQQCGQVWLNTFQKINSFFSAANQIPFVIAGTWDDYEEGTEIETGIDNCFNVAAAGKEGSEALLFWQLGWHGAPSQNTIDHYTVYSSTDGENLSVFQDNVQCSTAMTSTGCSLDVNNSAQLPKGTYQFFVKAVGKPSIQNHLSSGVSLTLKDFALRESISGSSFGTLTVSASTRPGYAGTISLTANVNPAGPTVNLSPTAIGPTGSSTVTVSFPNTAGTWTVTVTGTDGTTSSSISQEFAIVTPFLTLSIPSPSVELVAGNFARFSVNASAANGFNGTVGLSASGLPAGVRASFSPTSIAGGSGSSQLTLSTSLVTPPGTYQITITGSNGSIVSNQTITLTVDAPPSGGDGGGGVPCGRTCLEQ